MNVWDNDGAWMMCSFGIFDGVVTYHERKQWVKKIAAFEER